MKTKLKQLTLILTLSITSLSYAQEIERFYYDDGTIKQVGAYNAEGNATGEWKIYHKNGNLAKVGGYIDGKGTGEWKIYDENGFLTEVGDYRDSKRTGEWKIYHKNGVLTEVGDYRDSKRTGEWKFYDQNGNLAKVGGYIDGNGTGEWKLYHKNGNLAEVGGYIDGKRAGEWKFYDQNGFLTEVGDYRDSKATGEWKLYEKNEFLKFNGYLKAVGNYDKGEKTGEWTIYGDINITSIRNFSTSTLAMYRRGTLISKGNLDDNGKRTGEWKEYHKDGSISAEGSYSNDLQIGVWKEYHENGKLQSIGSHNGVGEFFLTSRKGEWKTYHDNGQLESIGNYTENDMNLTGKWSFYHKNGTLDKEKDFLNGKLQSEVTIDENSGTKEEIIYYTSGEIKTKLQYRTPDDLLNVIVSKGPNGEDLDYGSLKDGNGTYKEYNIEGKLINILTVKDGKVITKENEESYKEKKANTTKAYGLFFAEQDSKSVSLYLNDYKTYKKLKDRMTQIICSDSIPKIILEGDTITRNIYFPSSCDNNQIIRPLLKEKNTIVINGDLITKPFDGHYLKKDYPIDSLKNYLNLNLKNFGKIPSLSNRPSDLHFIIRYDKDDNLNKLKENLLKITQAFDEVGGNNVLKIILSELFTPPPPPPAPKNN